MAKQKFKIRDVIYEYVFFTEVEKHIVEHSLFQRLRFVSQNSSAYLTYPSNQLTRFSHSIGVMHLGSRMLFSSFSNADHSTFKEYLSVFENEILIKTFNDVFDTKNYTYQEFQKEWILKYGNLLEYNSSKTANDQEIFLVNIICQSLRLACLVHDIGHFPFSHIFEMGLENFSNNSTEGKNLVQRLIDKIKNSLFDNSKITINKDISTTELHELYGAYLIQEIINRIDDSSQDFSLNALKLSFNIALKIFTLEKSNADRKQKDILKFLYDIVSSELDADRIDYVMRDAVSSGLKMGNFDFERLIQNFTLYKKEEEYYCVPTTNSISSIEQFYNCRYMLYEYVYYHHNVAKYDGLLIEIIKELLVSCLENDDEGLKEIVFRYNLVGNNLAKSHLELFYSNLDLLVFERIDDCWLRSLLQEVYYYLYAKNNESKLKVLINTFLYRKNENIISLFKTDKDINDLFKNVKDKIITDTNQKLLLKILVHENPNLLNGFINYNNNKFENEKAIIDEFNSYLSNDDVVNLLENNKKESLKETDLKKFFNKNRNIKIDNLKEVASNKGFSLIVKKTGPKILKNDAQILDNNNNKLERISDYSDYLKTSSELVNLSFPYYFGLFKENIKLEEKEIDDFKKETIVDFLLENIENYINTVVATKCKLKKDLKK